MQNLKSSKKESCSFPTLLKDELSDFLKDSLLNDLQNVWFAYAGTPLHMISSGTQSIRDTFQQQSSSMVVDLNDLHDNLT
ncbi:hypothetical protein TNCV_2743771 [Trichonephila clavipes]|nr:hypothetical protein TNCV_2743771 [Trichonephila clavipes]